MSRHAEHRHRLVHLVHSARTGHDSGGDSHTAYPVGHACTRRPAGRRPGPRTQVDGPRLPAAAVRRGLLLDRHRDRLHRVRAALPHPARRLAALRGGPVHRHRTGARQPRRRDRGARARRPSSATSSATRSGGPSARRSTSATGAILKKKYFDQTTAFFDKHGNKALVIGRFVPIVRTFITVVAGVSRMDRRRFFTWSAVGAVLWVASLTLLGYFLGQAFPWLSDNLEIAVLLIVAVSVLPDALRVRQAPPAGQRHRRGDRGGRRGPRRPRRRASTDPARGERR